MTTRQRVVLRGLAVAAFATHSAAFFHVAAGGATPHAVAVALAAVLAVPVCTILLRYSGILSMSAAIGISQFAFHWLFDFFGVAGNAGSVTAAGHHGHMIIFTASKEGVDAPPYGAAMIIAHAVAAAATVAIARLAQGTWSQLETQAQLLLERVVDRVRAAVVTTTTPLPSLIPSMSAARLMGSVDHLLLQDRASASGFLRHRGPPIESLPSRPSA